MKGTARAFGYLTLALLLTGCSGLFCRTETYSYHELVPLYLSIDEITDVKSLPPQAIEQPGKIYLHHDLILINELNKGVHVLDNSDPRAPTKLAFVAIPGNHDLLVRQDETGTVLYADNYTDLIALDLSDPTAVTVLKRLENVFGSFYPEPVPAERGVLIGYEEGEIVTGRYRSCPGGAVASPTPAPDSAPSQGGSLARFAALDDFLYTIDGDAVQSFRLKTLADPVLFNRVSVDFGIETLFPHARDEGDQLYVGGNAGLYILDASNPANLRKQGQLTHVQSCDPVVVQDDLAYVTLQGSCFNQSNRLEIIDVSDPHSPELVSDYALQEPYGLGVDGDHLFVCDGAAGLKVYKNAREPENLELVLQLEDVQARDIIPWQGIAVVIAENGFFQYDYSNLAEGEMTLLSKIPVPESGN